MIERVALTAKPAAIRRRNNPNMTGGESQYLSERAVNVVRGLGRTPQRQLLIRIKMSDRGVLLHRQMRVAFIKESVFANQVGLSESFIQIAKFQRHFLMHISTIAIFVNAWLLDHETFFDRSDGLQRPILDFNQIHGVEGDVFINGGDGGNGITNETYLVDAERMLVLTDRQNAVGNRKIFAGNNRDYTWQRQRFR